MRPLTQDDADIPSHPNRLIVFLAGYLLTLAAVGVLLVVMM